MDQELLSLCLQRAEKAETWREVADLVRLFARIERDPQSGCWLWTGARNKGGYGYVEWLGHHRVVHRVVYGLLVGAVSRELTLDHLCRNRPCVNPEHLEPCSLEENVRRGWIADKDRPNRNREKSHCPRGHLYDDANTYYTPGGDRKCRACVREAKAKRRKSKELAAREREIRRASYHRNKGERLPPAGERTHCPQGHEYTPENTYINATSGGRICRACRRT